MASREAATPSECLMRTPKIPAGRAADTRAAAAGAADPAAGGRAADGRVADAQATEPQAADAQVVDAQATESRAAEARTTETRATGAGTAETQAAGGRAAAGAPRPGGRLRAGARRAADTIRAVLARHWLLAVLLLAGLVLRVLTQVAYRPVLFYIDSTRYLYHAGGNDPVGYRVPLRLILLAGNLDAVAAVQHVLGLAIAVAIYLVLLRRGCARWLAALAAAPVLLDAYQLQIEQTVMPDVWFEALVVAGLALLLWRRWPPWWMAAAAGVVLGLSATVAQVGEVLLLPAVVYALAAGGGWRRALGRAGLLCVAFVVPILVYMGVAASVTGHFRLSNVGTGGLYGRAAAAADCATLRVPASQRAMCPTAAQKAALGEDGLLHSPVSPVRRYYAELPAAEASHTVSAFTRAVFAQQPLRVASAIASDAAKLFAVRRVASPGDTPISRWQFQVSYPFYSPHATPREVNAAIAQFGGGAPAVTAPLARFLRGYQLGGGYTPGPLYAIAVLAALIGSLSLVVRRRAGPRDRDLALGCLLFFLSGAAVLLVSDVLEFSWRYQLPALITLPPAGALGLMIIAGRIRSRRRA
jgi:hypothetical protein